MTETQKTKNKELRYMGLDQTHMHYLYKIESESYMFMIDPEYEDYYQAAFVDAKRRENDPESKTRYLREAAYMKMKFEKENQERLRSVTEAIDKIASKENSGMRIKDLPDSKVDKAINKIESMEKEKKEKSHD